jgi:hypothetical protein
MTMQPTLLGHVGAVSGSTISVRQSPGLSSGIAIIGGKTYRIGQVGSFVRIPQGYHDLYGVVTIVGATAIPIINGEIIDRGDRWTTVQLVGEIVGASFERGISQFPSIKDEVHLVTEENLGKIYGNIDSGQIVVGRLANAESISIRIDLDKLVTRHSAILGSTGSGKSTTVASILRSVCCGYNVNGERKFPSSRVLLIDIHGEYSRSFRDDSAVFKINHNLGENPLYIPYWALDTNDLLGFLMGKVDDKVSSQIFDRIHESRVGAVNLENMPGIDLSSMTFDSPIPFSLKKLWIDLIDPEIKTWANNERSTPALIQAGNAETLTAPKYRPPGAGSSLPHMNNQGVLGIRRHLDQMRSRLLDKQYDFLLHPGPWEPDLDGEVEKDIPDLLLSWFGHDKPVTILDLSGVPSIVLARLLGAILRIVCESFFWGREKSEGGFNRPLLVVMEEAHRYLGKDSDGPARSMVQRVVKEGRKFGIGAMIVSQRPSEVDETILSQCGTFIALRMSNAVDRAKIQATLPDGLSGIIDSLPILRTGEAIITGEAARLPIRCRITLPSEENRPNSEDPKVSDNWSKNKISEDYKRFTASWRSQNPRWAKIHPHRNSLPLAEQNMERDPVHSTNIISIGYNSESTTLEIEFKGGAIYQYYNVPQITYDGLMQASSKGQYFHAMIRNNFATSRV